MKRCELIRNIAGAFTLSALATTICASPLMSVSEVVLTTVVTIVFGIITIVMEKINEE